MNFIRSRAASLTAPIRASNWATRSVGAHAVSDTFAGGAAWAGAASAANSTRVSTVRRMASHKRRRAP